MSRARKRWLIIVGIVLSIPLAFLGAALFLGLLIDGPALFHNDDFAQLDTALSPDHQAVAVIGLRSDHKALSGTDQFVFIGKNEKYSWDDLHKVFSKRKYIFNDQNENPGNLHVRWTSDTGLVVTCLPCVTTSLGIARRYQTSGNIHIAYVGLPEDSQYTEKEH